MAALPPETDATEARRQLGDMLGFHLPAPALDAPVRSGRETVGDWWLDHVQFRNADGAPIAACFLRPPDGHGPVPAVIYAHAHGNRYATGCAELTEGRPALVAPYAPDLQRAGLAALCLDMPAFGSRSDPDEDTRAKALLWQGRTLFGQMLWELSGAVGYLARHTVIDPHRIGALGFSMGSTHAWWLASLDTRIAAASALCSFADLGCLVGRGEHAGHGIYMMVPGLVSNWTSADIAALAAPRPLQIAVGLRDWSTPESCFAPARDRLVEHYERAGARDKLAFHVEAETGHEETPAMRATVLDFLSRHLRVSGG